MQALSISELLPVFLMLQKLFQGDATNVTPPPPPHKKHLGATVPSHPRGNLPQVTVPSPPLLTTMQGTLNTQQDTQTTGHMNH